MSAEPAYPDVQLRRSVPPVVGAAVLRLQQRLGELGFTCADLSGAKIARLPGGAPRADIAGLFGHRTAAVVAEFQRSKGLEPDSIVGRRTWAALFEPTVSASPQPQPQPQPTTADGKSEASDVVAEPTDARFGDAMKFVLGWEGGFVDDPDDRGGRTNKGVTAAVYNGWRDRKKLPRRDVKLITDQEVRQIYIEDYWLAAKCDRIGEPIGLVQFDTAVNMGPGRAVRFLQAAAQVHVDGRFGSTTMNACTACDMGILLTRYCAVREAFYRRLATNPGQGKFLRGWLNRLNDLRDRIGLPRSESVDGALESGDSGRTSKAGELEEWEEELLWETPDSADLLALVTQAETLAAGNDQAALEGAANHLVQHLRSTGTRLTYGRGVELLRHLRAHRRFGNMEHIGDALIQTGCDGTGIKMEYAQALIEGGKLAPAIDMLERLATRTRGSETDNASVCGLLGRAWKQTFVTSGATDTRAASTALGKSIAAYHESLENATGDDRWWPAINLVAMAARARSEGIEAAIPVDTMALAQSIVAAFGGPGNPGPWDIATLAEANIALGRWPESERLLRAYVAHPATDAFMLSSTLRQLREVWRLDRPGTQGSDLVTVLSAELLRREGGSLELTPAVARELETTPRSSFERVLGEPGMVTWQWMRTGLARAAAVAILRQPDSRGVGTGFLVRGGDLAPALGDARLLLTNAHVVSPNPADRPAVRPSDARVVFDAASDRPEFGIAEVVWTSPVDELDATLLRLDGEPTIDPCPIFDGDLPDPASAEADPTSAKLYIIGHPLGGELSFSIQDNKLLDHEGPPSGEPSRPSRVFVHYRTPTEPGSSGSPVFDPIGWRVIALHHAGAAYMRRLNGKAGTYAANEGIWIGSIRSMLAKTKGDEMSAD